ncbi:MAG TPA: hypothetical protein VFO34_18460 [Candidatus Acidoferrales bacterium]|nr:hypothetical protein [Candidatus Acidoferrales bacterium]
MATDIDPAEPKQPAPKKTAADWNQQLGEIFLFFLGAAGSALFLWIVINAIGWLFKRN